MIMHEKDIKFVHELLDTPSYICRGGGGGDSNPSENMDINWKRSTSN